MFQLYSPNMLKTFANCPKKFYFRYVKNISMPVSEDIFELGKNIHALASYYLRKENLSKLEAGLNERELSIWNYLKTITYFSYETVNTEYNLSVKLGNYFFGGRIDALVKDKDVYYILDYKTGTPPANPKYDYQTMIYLMAVRTFFNTNKIVFVYIDLKTREEVKVVLTSELIEEYETRLINIAQNINDDIFDKKQNKCICEYSKICY
ncbi:PD-(D/E)XK nuclease family protein [bacterium]|nr:PD-(D/E)XK nuclease family protein [bacterium]